MAHWDKIEAIAANGGCWTYLDEALWLVCRGVTLAQAASVIASNRKALGRWIDKMRLDPKPAPDWLIQLQETQRQHGNPET